MATEVATFSTCIYSCDAVKNGMHLFWLCPVASLHWKFYLLPFRDCLDGKITWSQLLSSSRLLPATIKDYGHRALWDVFNIVRCCVFRSLWLHRNKRLYNPGTLTKAIFVRHHSFAYVDLHLRKIKYNRGAQELAWHVAVLIEIYAWHFVAYFRPNSLFLAGHLILLWLNNFDLTLILLSVHGYG